MVDADDSRIRRMLGNVAARKPQPCSQLNNQARVARQNAREHQLGAVPQPALLLAGRRVLGPPLGPGMPFRKLAQLAGDLANGRANFDRLFLASRDTSDKVGVQRSQLLPAELPSANECDAALSSRERCVVEEPQ